MPEKDINQKAFEILKKATESSEKHKNPAAVSLGRLGGLVGGEARAKSLSAKERHEIALKAAKARWLKNG